MHGRAEFGAMAGGGAWLRLNSESLREQVDTNRHEFPATKAQAKAKPLTRIDTKQREFFHQAKKRILNREPREPREQKPMSF